MFNFEDEHIRYYDGELHHVNIKRRWIPDRLAYFLIRNRMYDLGSFEDLNNMGYFIKISEPTFKNLFAVATDIKANTTLSYELGEILNKLVNEMIDTIVEFVDTDNVDTLGDDSDDDLDDLLYDDSDDDLDDSDEY